MMACPPLPRRRSVRLVGGRLAKSVPAGDLTPAAGPPCLLGRLNWRSVCLPWGCGLVAQRPPSSGGGGAVDDTTVRVRWVRVTERVEIRGWSSY